MVRLKRGAEEILLEARAKAKQRRVELEGIGEDTREVVFGRDEDSDGTQSEAVKLRSEESNLLDPASKQEENLLGESPPPPILPSSPSPRPSPPGEPSPEETKDDCRVAVGSSCCVVEGTSIVPRKSVTKHWCTLPQALSELFVSHQALVPPLARAA